MWSKGDVCCAIQSCTTRSCGSPAKSCQGGCFRSSAVHRGAKTSMTQEAFLGPSWGLPGAFWGFLFPLVGWCGRGGWVRPKVARKHSLQVETPPKVRRLHLVVRAAVGHQVPGLSDAIAQKKSTSTQKPGSTQSPHLLDTTLKRKGIQPKSVLKASKHSTRRPVRAAKLDTVHSRSFKAAPGVGFCSVRWPRGHL